MRTPSYTVLEGTYDAGSPLHALYQQDDVLGVIFQHVREWWLGHVMQFPLGHPDRGVFASRICQVSWAGLSRRPTPPKFPPPPPCTKDSIVLTRLRNAADWQTCAGDAPPCPRVGQVTFPPATVPPTGGCHGDGININMMPFVIGDLSSIPEA